MANEKTKKLLSVISTVFTYILVVLAIGMMIFTLISVNTFDKNDRSIFGFKFYIVQTNSMSLSENNAADKVHFDAGDIVLIKNVEDKTALRAGDVIAFISQNHESYGSTVTHMIREIKYTENGRVEGYVTYGTNTGTNDESLVEPDFVLGVYSGKLPKVGLFFQFLKTTPGYIICILIPFLLLILYQGINCIRIFRKYKREQMEEMQAERDKIEQERAESQKMMAELLELKARLIEQENIKTQTPVQSEGETPELQTEPRGQEESDSIETVEPMSEPQIQEEPAETDQTEKGSVDLKEDTVQEPQSTETEDQQEPASAEEDTEKEATISD